MADMRQQAQTSQRTLEQRAATCSDDLSTTRVRLGALQSDHDALNATLAAVTADLRRKEEALLRTETALAMAERDHVRTQEDLRSAVQRSHGLQASDIEAREQLGHKNSHIDGLRNTLAVVQEQLSQKDASIARLQADLATKEEQLLNVSQRAERHERKLQDKLAYHKEKEQLLAEDLHHLHRYVGRREVEVCSVIAYRYVSSTHDKCNELLILPSSLLGNRW